MAAAALLAHPKAGASFETFCIEQVILHARLYDPQAQAFFFRTHTGTEVDLLLALRGRLVPIEIKLGSSIPDTRSLESCMADLSIRRGFVASAVAQRREIGNGILLCGLGELLHELHRQEGGVLVVVTHSLDLAATFSRRLEL